MIKKIIIPYFPKGLKYITPLFIASGIYSMVLGYFILGAILVLLTVVVLTTNYITEINLQKKNYKDFISLCGVPLNVESTDFKKLDRIIITKGNYAQTINTRVQSRTMKWSDYTGTLLFDSNKTLDLVTRNDKSELVNGLKDFAKFLDVQIEDRTGRDFYRIDPNR